MVRECSLCQELKKSERESSLHPWKRPSHILDHFRIDYAGPFMGKMFFILIDAHSKWIGARCVYSSKSADSIECIMEIFTTHDLPKS